MVAIVGGRTGTAVMQILKVDEEGESGCYDACNHTMQPACNHTMQPARKISIECHLDI